jgi:hypothetical protein
MVHWHPAIEHVTVLSGAFFMGLGTRGDKCRIFSLARVCYAQAKIHLIRRFAALLINPENSFIWKPYNQ